MAAVNLPDSPANGTTQTVNGITYTYNSSKGYWTTASSGTATTQVTTSDSAPSNPADGDLWYDTDTGGIFVYYADGTSNQWVQIIGQQGEQGPQGTLSTSDSAPSNPSDGDLWYDTDDGGLFIYYADGSSNQWVEVVGQQGAQGPAGPSGATTIVANTTALLAISSPSTGEMAYVTGNSTLYFYNGSGWYKIALINTTPSISGVSSSYALAVDGTATTVTIVASDPEGLPITYSIASDTSGNIATVAQGTGASTNVWTITPSTNTAHAGSFSLTFRASDGVNFATAASTFTLTFIVQNQNYTTALVTSVGANNAVNNTFDDKTTSNHTITTTGDVHHCGMSPYRPGGYSTYFDGSNTSLSLGAHADFAFGTGDFTIEWWCNLPDQSNSMFIDWRQGGSGSGNLHIGTGGYGGSLAGAVRFTGDGPTIVSTSVVDDNEWHHVAICRASGTTKMYIDGTEEGSASDTTNYARQGLRIGNNSYSSGGNHLHGYMADLRFVKGTAVYTSNFTPPTERLTAITNTSLLTCHLPYIADGSTTGHSITVNGGTHTLPFAPYDAREYSNGDHLGSAHFDGTGDKLTISGTYANFGTNPFTIEAWVYPYTCKGPIFTTHRVGTASGFYFAMDDTNDNLVHGRFFGSNADTFSPNNSVILRQWNHFVLCREGTGSNQTRMFINGKIVATYTDNSDYSSAPYGPYIGGYDAGGTQYDLIGNTTDIRVVSGTAVYTAEFTPPTAPLSTITNTALHLPMADGGIIDKAQSTNTLKLYGNAKSSTAYTKYLTSSIYLDGTGDYIDIAPAFSNFFDFGTLPFTIEFWMYLTAVNGERIILESRAGHTDAGLLIMLNSGVMKNLTSGAVRTTGGTTIAANTWYHVAVVRDSTSLRTYLNGTEETGSASYTSAVTAPFSKFRLGARFDGANPPAGYFSDVRITKGLARYTSNFTAPTAALQG